jgi:parallel beta-helix repeat protein
MMRVWSPADRSNDCAHGTRVGGTARPTGLAGAMLAATVLGGMSWSAVDVAGQSAPAAPSNVVVLVEAPNPSWISIFPGSSIQGVVNAYPGGTTFYIRAGVHRQQRINPKTNNVFVGEAGAVLDGENVATYAFLASNALPQNVTIRNLEIANYATPSQSGAIQGDNGFGWVVADNRVHDNLAIGIRTGKGWQVLRNTVYRNGVIGISGYRANGALIADNDIYENNWLQAPELPVNAEAAGIKFGETANATVRNNHVHGNLAKGIWMDHCLPTSIIEGNTIVDNWHQGIFYEISYAGVIRNNIVDRNALKPVGIRAGIQVTNSPNVEVYGNTVRDNANGITGQQTTGVNATTGVFGPLRTEDLYVHDNAVRMRVGKTGLTQNTGETAVYSTWNNRFQGNSYTLGLNSTYFSWADRSLTETQWQATGNDVTGQFVR